MQSWRSHRAKHEAAGNGNNQAWPTRHRTNDLTIRCLDYDCDPPHWHVWHTRFGKRMASHGTVSLYLAMRTPPRRWSCRKLLRSKGEGRQCATMSPGICIEAFKDSAVTMSAQKQLHIGLVGRTPATLKKRVPINRRSGDLLNAIVYRIP